MVLEKEGIFFYYAVFLKELVFMLIVPSERKISFHYKNSPNLCNRNVNLVEFPLIIQSCWIRKYKVRIEAAV